jgi:pimeloyl-ACP methyl ester carboxylesterase
VVLLHGFPTSSHMFRNLIPALADLYHVIAPDYPGYGQSDMPDRNKFAYTFDRFAELVDVLLDQLRVTRYDKADEIVPLIRDFLRRKVAPQ